MTLDIPVIESARLILRGPREADFPVHAAFMAGPRSHFLGGPHGRFEAWRGFLALPGHWALRGFGAWIVERKDDGAVIGRVGFIEHDGWDEPELGWTLYDGHEGQGYATEAVLAARAHGPAFGIRRPISYIAPGNVRSLALARRLGAEVERERELLGAPCLVFRHPEGA